MPKLLKGNGVNTFLSGVLSLGISTLIVKIIGLIYKIPMLSLVGGEGMGYFNSAYEIYALLCIVSVTGLPVAMAVIISRSKSVGRAEDVFKLSLGLLSLLGILFMLAMMLFSRQIALYLKSERAVYCIIAIAPSLAFVCMGSAYKGYFQGLSDMRPVSVSTLIEALSKLVLGLLFSGAAKSMGCESFLVAAFGIFSISIGSFLSLVYFAIYKKRRSVSESEAKLCGLEKRKILLDIAKISLPATISSLLLSLVRVIDMVMILRRLQDLGYSSADANMMYGSYTTMAIPIFSLAAALVSSISVPLIPELSKACADGDISGQGEKISCAMSLTSYISAPIMVGISLFSREILELVFASQGAGIDISAPLLACLGLSVTTSVLITLTNAMLQAYNSAAMPIISMAVGCTLKIILSFVLIGNRSINIMGAPIGTFFCDIMICLLNFVFLSRRFKGKISFKETLLEPSVFAFASILPAFFLMRRLQKIFDGRIITLVCICISGIVYLILAGRKILKIKDIGV